MADPSLLLAEPLIQEAAARNIRCSGKLLVSLFLLSGFGYAILASQVSSTNDGVQEPVITMASQFMQQPSMQSARAQQFVQPGMAWRSMQSTRARQFVKPVASDDADAVAVAGTTFSGRRAALASGLAAVATLPNMAWADGRDNTLTIEDPSAGAEALQRQVEAQAAAKQAKKIKEARAPDEVKKEEEGKLNGVYVALGAGALSVPLFAQNLKRLGTKIASGGKDDGYGDSGVGRGSYGYGRSPATIRGPIKKKKGGR